MTKHFARPQFPPRPSKGTLAAAAKKQVKADEAKAKMETLATVDSGEVTASDVATVKEVLAAVTGGDQQAAADAIVANLTNDPTAGEAASVIEPPAAPAPAAESPQSAATDTASVQTVEPPAVAPTSPVAAPKPPKGTTDGLYALGKRYSPKTDRNSDTWAKICKCLADGPKTMKELGEAVKGHGDFLGYMTRGGHIVPHKVEQKVSG